MAGKSLGLEPKVEKHFAWSNWHIKHYVLGYAKESDLMSPDWTTESLKRKETSKLYWHLVGVTVSQNRLEDISGVM